MTKLYRSPYEAYPFLADKTEDFRCDYELWTDRLASKIGLLRAKCADGDYYEELKKMSELVYHANACLRTKVTITEEEIAWLNGCVERLREETIGKCERFVLPVGCELSALAHLLRVDCKEIVRLMYRHQQNGKEVVPILVDLFNLLSGYFFILALKFNMSENIEEIPFISRNYK